MTIKLYNTKTRSKEAFTPLDPENVRMYVCGPTVYDRAHLGNARSAVVFDVLYRLLRHEYGSERVNYVRNFTDVDDKINATALARKEAGADGTLEELVQSRSDETIAWYHEDMDALGVERPTHEPRATQFIGQMIAMIEGLIAGSHAHAKEGHVLFRVRSYKDYGKLSGRSVDDMIAGARVEVAPFKEDPMDFVLWKPSDDALPGWDSPWGRGRPGWHIECSAMAFELLGESFDIHGGGNDLTFPHHENEIAQSACMGHGFANVWMHNEMLQVEGKKMSKSLGNFFTVRELLDQGVPGEVIRFVLLSTHYRKPMDWTEEKRSSAQRTLIKWYSAIRDGGFLNVPSTTEYLDELKNDLNTPMVVSLLFGFYSLGAIEKLAGGLKLLGLLNNGVPEWVPDAAKVSDGVRIITDIRVVLTAEQRETIKMLIRQWQEARKLKNFDSADALKAALKDIGIEVRATSEHPEADVQTSTPPNWRPSNETSLKCPGLEPGPLRSKPKETLS